ncbi:MAG: hypothetical protein ACREVL_13605 [Solimonas sp.]
MNIAARPRSGFELVLLLWTALQIPGFFYVLIAGPIRIWGSGWQVWLPMAIIIPAAFALLWFLRRPTTGVLLLGALYWAIQAVQVQLPNALYAVGIGFAIVVDIVNKPELIVTINIIAIVTALAFLAAALDRRIRP